MDDLRLEWIKVVVCKHLNIKETKAFDDLFERDANCAKALYAFLAGSREKRCVFIYDTEVEEEIEIETSPDESGTKLDAIEEETDANLPVVADDEEEEGQSDRAVSVQIADDTEGGSEEILSTEERDESTEEIVPQKKFLKQLVKKKSVLHICLNVSEYVPRQRYVYLLLRKFDPVPFIETWEETVEIMHNYFEVGIFNKHPVVNMLDDITLLQMACSEYKKSMEDIAFHTSIIVDQLQKPCLLELPYIPYNSPEQLALDQAFVLEAEDLVRQWNSTLRDFIDKISIQKPSEKNPFLEIIFWKERQSEISAVSDYFGNPSLQLVIKVLQLTNFHGVRQFDDNCAIMRKQLYTTKDNINYLMNIEPYLKDLKDESPLSSAIYAVAPLMDTYKLLWTLSDYYGRAENMGRLIEGLGLVIENKIFHTADVQKLFDKDISEIQCITEDCCLLAEEWKASYHRERDAIDTFEGLQHWYYNLKLLFKNTDYMATICENLCVMSKEVEQMRHILKPELKIFAHDLSAVDSLEVQITDLPLRIKHVDFDIFTPKNSLLWKNLMHWFRRQCSVIEKDAKTLISKILQQESSLEAAVQIIQTFNDSNMPRSIQELICERYAEILNRYCKELDEVENSFITMKDSPSDFRGYPSLTSHIIWERHLLGSIKTPMLLFCKDKDFGATEMGQKVQQQYLKVARALRKYETDIFNDWKMSMSKRISLCLQITPLTKSVSNTYHYTALCPDERERLKGTKLADMNYNINFPVELDEIMINAGIMKYMGFVMPPEITNFISEEETYTANIKDLNVALFKLRSILGSLNYAEVKLLERKLETLSDEVEPGLYHLQWASLGIPEFIEKMQKATDFFGSIVHQVKQLDEEIHKKIKLLKSANLFHLKKVNPDHISMCQLYFEEAERRMTDSMEDDIKTYNSILPLLYKVEALTCHSSSGYAKPMREYYRQCEIEILNALTEMIIDNLELLSGALESHIFPYFSALFKSTDTLVVASTERAVLTFKMYLVNCIKSTALFKRWMEGTCVQVSQHTADKQEEPFEYTFYSDVCLHPTVQKLTASIIARVNKFISTL